MQQKEQIRKQVEQYKAQGKKVFATSSFQSHSIPLLHLISEIDRSIPIFYLQTGFLFPETLSFKDELAQRLGLNFIALRSDVPKSQQKDAKGQLFFTSDPDYCCYLNKTRPLEPILQTYDVWINGIRRDQNMNRSKMNKVEATPFRSIRYHPMLDWTAKDIFDYRKLNNLPPHPKEQEGYLSVGCEPCTRKMVLGGDERSSRWFGMNKVECGLHTDLISK